MRRWIAIAAIAVSSAGCLRDPAFHCSASSPCGTGETCQTAQGLCSVSDSNCASGAKFADSAGSLAGACVGGGDAGTDGMPPDSPVGCDATYAPLPNFSGPHVYKPLTTSDTWDNQSATCGNTTTHYLAVPSDATEQTALDTLALQRFAAPATYWIGIEYTAGAFAPVNGETGGYTHWPSGAPNNPGAAKCVGEVPGTGPGTGWFNEKCGGAGSMMLPAICECEP